MWSSASGIVTTMRVAARQRFTAGLTRAGLEENERQSAGSGGEGDADAPYRSRDRIRSEGASKENACAAPAKQATGYGTLQVTTSGPAVTARKASLHSKLLVPAGDVSI
jgi:hypothetical protein